MVVVVWTSIGAVVGGVIVLISLKGCAVVWEWLVESGCLVEALRECCSTLFVLVVASVGTIAGFLL